MAWFDDNKICPECHKPGVWDHCTYCSSCDKIVYERNRDKHLSKLDEMTIEQRLRRIEKWIYDYKPKYVRPPRF